MRRMGNAERSGGSGRGRVAHGLVPVAGRDPEEIGRAVTPLELLFDLTFVVAVGTAANHFAELLAEGHPAEAVAAFALAMFGISVAWINFSWFASAFGTDDWLHRVLTMVQMCGVVVFSLGLPPSPPRPGLISHPAWSRVRLPPVRGAARGSRAPADANCPGL